MRLIWSQSHVTLLILGRSCVTHKPLPPFVFLCVEHLQDFWVDSELQIYVLVQKMLPRIILILLSYATPTVSLKDVRAKIFQHWFFSETFTTVRWWVSYVRNVKRNRGSPTSLANKATVSASSKILQLDLWNEMFSAKYCLCGPIW